MGSCAGLCCTLAYPGRVVSKHEKSPPQRELWWACGPVARWPASLG